jgi:ketosteroid isomerase-like protein
VSATTDDELRRANKALFLKLLGHLGRKEFEPLAQCLAADLVQEWPYLPLASMPHVLHGRDALLELMQRGMADFDPYCYEVDAVHDMLDPNMLVAEYRSNSFYRPRRLPYANRYISVLRFREGKLAHWVEYVNPLIIKEAMLDDADKPIDERFETNADFHGQGKDA